MELYKVMEKKTYILPDGFTVEAEKLSDLPKHLRMNAKTAKKSKAARNKKKRNKRR